jgi:hypothetical protein
MNGWLTEERVIFGQPADLAFERDLLGGYRLAGDQNFSRNLCSCAPTCHCANFRFHANQTRNSVSM